MESSILAIARKSWLTRHPEGTFVSQFFIHSRNLFTWIKICLGAHCSLQRSRMCIQIDEDFYSSDLH